MSGWVGCFGRVASPVAPAQPPGNEREGEGDAHEPATVFGSGVGWGLALEVGAELGGEFWAGGLGDEGAFENAGELEEFGELLGVAVIHGRVLAVLLAQPICMIDTLIKGICMCRQDVFYHHDQLPCPYCALLQTATNQHH